MIVKCFIRLTTDQFLANYDTENYPETFNTESHSLNSTLRSVLDVFLELDVVHEVILVNG